MNSREIALKVINDVLINEAYANIALAHEINRRQLSEQDRRFITELVYGTIKTGKTLDWLLMQFVSRSLDKVAPVIRNILRMGVYQLFFLSKVPASAACNQSVELTKKYGHAGTVKFVNGVLRNIARNKETIKYPDKDQDPVKHIALKYFHPEWLVRRWMESLGLEACEKLCEFNNKTPALSVRTNNLKITREELIAILATQGVNAEPSQLVPEGIVCTEHPSLSQVEALAQGLFQVQDESSMLVAHVLGGRAGEFIIDACAAPGGKSTHIAALMDNQGKVLSLDIHPHKLSLIADNASRLGIDIIETAHRDATTIGKEYFQMADRVLVDAPCSGLGVLRRRPDSRWRKSPEQLQELPILQNRILNSAADCVKPGGILVYSTCTIGPEENDEVVKNFLAQRKDFSLDNTGSYLPQPREDNTVQLWPHTDGVDGFYIARMCRKSL